MDSKNDHGKSGRLREVTGGFGRLLALHLKIAQLELRLELRAVGVRLRGLAMVVGLSAVGYAMAMTGLAFILAGWRSVGVPFAGIGLGHGVLAGLVYLSLRIRKNRFMGESSQALRTSIASLHQAASPAGRQAEPPSDSHHVH